MSASEGVGDAWGDECSPSPTCMHLLCQTYGHSSPGIHRHRCPFRHRRRGPSGGLNTPTVPISTVLFKFVHWCVYLPESLAHLVCRLLLEKQKKQPVHRIANLIRQQ